MGYFLLLLILFITNWLSLYVDKLETRIERLGVAHQRSQGMKAASIANHKERLIDKAIVECKRRNALMRQKMAEEAAKKAVVVETKEPVLNGVE